MRTGIATVSLSGTLEEKLTAAASAGFDGVEIMDADVTSSHLSPRAIGARVRSLGMTVDLFQPIRDVEGVGPESFRRNARRVAAKLDVAAELGAPGVLLCSNVASAVVDDDDLVAGQLHELGELAAARGLTIAYEALAWGRFVSTYDHAWRLAVAADHPAVGTCLDSFHIFAAGSDLKHIARLPAERVIFCQVADARGLSLDPLTWSRHHRLFPGQGVFDLRRFVMTVDSMGYAGPYSLEVFNDVFRQTTRSPPPSTVSDPCATSSKLSTQPRRYPPTRQRSSTSRSAPHDRTSWKHCSGNSVSLTARQDPTCEGRTGNRATLGSQ